MLISFLTETMIKTKDKVNEFPRIFNGYLYKALNPSLTIDKKLIYIRKLKLHLMLLLNMLNDIETELISEHDTQSRTNFSV